MASRLAAIGAGVAVVALAGGGIALYRARSRAAAPTLVRRELPGFSIDLPQGAIKGQSLGYMQGGSATTRDGSALLDLVQWSPASATPDLEAVAHGVAAKMGANARVGDVRMAGDIAMVRVDAASGPVELSIELCGLRQIVVLLAGDDDALQRAVVSSLRCHPDAAKERAPTAMPLPIALDLPSNWHSIERDSSNERLTDGHSLLWLSAVRPTPAVDLGPVLETTLRPLGYELTVDEARVPNARTFATATLHGRNGLAFAQVVACGGAEAALVLALTDDHDRLSELETIVDRARCLAPDEAH